MKGGREVGEKNRELKEKERKEKGGASWGSITSSFKTNVCIHFCSGLLLLINPPDGALKYQINLSP